MKTLTTICIICLLPLAGCGDLTQAAKEAIKSSDQRQAEQLCLRAAAKHEAQRTPELKGLLDGPAETQSLGPNHYLIRVTYKMVTLNDPGAKSDDLNVFSGANCEVAQGKIIHGRLDRRASDVIYGVTNRVEWKATYEQGDSSHGGTGTRAGIESVLQVITRLEQEFPETNPRAPSYRQDAVNQIVALADQIEKGGASRPAALEQATRAVIQQLRNSGVANGSPITNSPAPIQPSAPEQRRNVAPPPGRTITGTKEAAAYQRMLGGDFSGEQPHTVDSGQTTCVVKPVMTDADLALCKRR